MYRCLLHSRTLVRQSAGRIGLSTLPETSTSLLTNGNFQRLYDGRYFSSSTGSGDTSAADGKNDNSKNGDEAKGGGQKEEELPPERFPMPDKDMELKLAAMQTKVSDYYKQGNYTKALSEAQKLLRKTESHFGQNHPVTASSYNNVGLMQKHLGDFVEARRHYTAAMRIYAKVVGRDHASYAMTLHNLGTLNKSQVHFDTTLKATERLNLVETALEYFEEAWAVRKAELGDEHPLTVATRSSFGSTLAAQVLYQHRYVQGGTEQSQKAKYVSLSPQSVTQKGWDAAEQHLREAMETAIANPRGQRIGGKSKKNKKKKTKKGGNKMETLSAAAAAQNLAVFLKSRAMTEDPYIMEMLEEAKDLYFQVQTVRSQLLPTHHPDLYATKYSLAELLEAIGDDETANVVRQEILDTYDPPSSDGGASREMVPEDEEDDNPDEDDELNRRRVVVERTKASKS